MLSGLRYAWVCVVVVGLDFPVLGGFVFGCCLFAGLLVDLVLVIVWFTMFG